jgi:hypothetical protein
MLDNPEKTAHLLTVLKASVPFEAALLPDLIGLLARQQKPVAVRPVETVSDVSYLGDEGGIACHIHPKDAGNMVLISLTHLRLSHTLPFAAAVFAYQKHRVKKLNKQRRVA